jgi:hypothetical protein
VSRTRHAVGAAALACLVVLAGCAAPTAAPGGAPTVEVRGPLPGDTDPGAVFERVGTLLDADADPPRAVRVLDAPPNGSSLPTRPFFSVVGVGPGEGLNESARRQLENGYTTAFGAVVVYPGADPTAGATERLLAHEFVHYVQFAERRPSALAADLPDTTDGAFVTRAVVEGVAVDTTDAYRRQHVPDRPPEVALYRDLAERFEPGSRQQYANLAYISGGQYVDARFGDPAAAAAVYRDPPETSERLLHPNQSGGPAPLAVAAAGDRWRPSGRDTLGEAFLRVALANGVSQERARRAATGWGNDSLVPFRTAERAGFAWTVRYDDAANASTGVEALRALAAAREAETDRTLAVRRVDARTVALVAGTDAFVATTTVRAAEGRVAVEAP